jgi:5-epimerase
MLMRTRKLAVKGAVEFSPPIFTDERGCFVSPYQEAAFVDAVGKPLFAVAQTNISLSRRGVVRGVHFTATPPGTAKLVYCTHGRVLDIVVDVRVGSPTYGKWDAVILDQEVCRASYLPLGVGHAFVALEDDSVMSYLLSQSYEPENEHALSVLDPALGLPIPQDIEPVLSERDLRAPGLAEARGQGMLPDYATCLRIEASPLVNAHSA